MAAQQISPAHARQAASSLLLIDRLLHLCRRVLTWFGDAFPLSIIDVIKVEVTVEKPENFVCPPIKSPQSPFSSL